MIAQALALALAATPLPADPTPVHSPVIDVIVTDGRGRAIENLQPADFSILDQGQVQTIAAARFIRAEARLFAIFLDEFHTAAGEAADRLRDALVRFVKDGLEPGDQVVVLKPLDSILSITLTTDRGAAMRAIETFQPRDGDYTARTPFERNYIAGTPERIAAARTQIVVSALNALATHLGTLGDGRKTLIVVSDGIGRRVRTQVDAPLPTLDTVQRSADRAHVSIYAFEVNSRSDDAVDAADRDALKALAEATGGRAVPATAEAGDALTRVLVESRAYYAITLSAAEPRVPGFHAVYVRVGRAGATVRARRGYWPLSAEDFRGRGVAAATPTTRLPEPPRRISPLVRPWFGMERGAAGTTRVSFVWEPAAIIPGDRSMPQRPARVALTVSRPDGTAVFEGLVLPAGADPAAEARPRAVFELPPGRLRVQMAIEDASSRLLDVDVRDLVVIPFQGPVAIGTAEVLRSRNAREFRALAGNPDAPPVASRQFSRSERLILRVPVYASGGAPQVSARLISRFGLVMRELAVDRTPGADRYQIDLPLAGLAAGEYSVDVSAATAEGQAKDTITFRVTN